MLLRSETPSDAEAIRRMLDLSFEDVTVSQLVDLIRMSDRFVPDLSIVAETDGSLVGHVMLSYVTIEGEESFEVLSLAPLAVHPDHQRLGIGTALIEEALARADERGEPLVVLEGHPDYYPRFGFERGSLLGIEKPAPQVPEDAFMVKRLSAYAPRFHGKLVYPPAFYEAGAVGP
jgi:putative acetyltransferase